MSAARYRIARGGVNLLPYRARASRRRRMYWLWRAGGVAACACVAASLTCLPDLLAARRIEAQRAEIERGVARMRVTVSAPAPSGGRQVTQLAAARASILDDFGWMGTLPFDGVRLRALHGDARGFSMRVEARDPVMAQAWLERLRGEHAGHLFEIEDLRALADGARRAAAAGDATAVAVTVRVSRRDVDGATVKRQGAA